MNIDRYTKFILTIIAMCQIFLVLKDTNVIKPAMAQSQVHVIIDSVSSYAFQYAGPLEVRSR